MSHFSSEPFIMGKPTAERAVGTRRHQGIPGIECTPAGRLLAAWYANSEPGEGPGNYVVLADALSGEEILHVTPPGENVRAFDPVLWLDPLKRLWLCWSQSYSRSLHNDIFDGKAGVWFARCDAPDAAEMAWTAPRRLGDGIMMNKPTVLSDGRWAFPAALWGVYPQKMLPELEGMYGANLAISADQGHSFAVQRGPAVPQRGFDEHILFECQDKTLQIWVRTDYGIGRSISPDGGKTWSLGEPTGIVGPASRFALKRLLSGALMLIYHRSEAVLPGEKFHSPRKALTAWISDDDGRTWQGGLLLDPRTAVSYPDATQDACAKIWCIYDHERALQGEILLACFTEADIRAGRFVSAGSFTNRLASAFPCTQ